MADLACQHSGEQWSCRRRGRGHGLQQLPAHPVDEHHRDPIDLANPVDQT